MIRQADPVEGVDVRRRTNGSPSTYSPGSAALRRRVAAARPARRSRRSARRRRPGPGIRAHLDELIDEQGIHRFRNDQDFVVARKPR